jgi:hypothetical protein
MPSSREASSRRFTGRSPSPVLSSRALPNPGRMSSTSSVPPKHWTSDRAELHHRPQAAAIGCPEQQDHRARPRSDLLSQDEARPDFVASHPLTGVTADSSRRCATFHPARAGPDGDQKRACASSVAPSWSDGAWLERSAGSVPYPQPPDELPAVAVRRLLREGRGLVRSVCERMASSQAAIGRGGFRPSPRSQWG